MSFPSSCLVSLSSFLCTRSALPLLDTHLWLCQTSNEDSNVTDTIELADLPAPNTQGYSSSRNAPNDSDEAQDLQHINSQHDELERNLQPKSLHNTDIQAFLATVGLGVSDFAYRIFAWLVSVLFPYMDSVQWPYSHGKEKEETGSYREYIYTTICTTIALQSIYLF